MNGYTKETPLKTRLHNLTQQIPQEFRADVLAQCIVNDNPHDFERYLTSAVIRRVWEENAVEQAYQIETEGLLADEADWLDEQSTRESVRPF